MLRCKLCGKFYKHLGSHIYHRHKITAKEYKIRFGLNINTALITDDVKAKKQRAFNERREHYLKNLKKGEKYRFQKGNQNRFYFSKQDIDRAKRELKKIKHIKGICFICGVEFNNLPNHLRLKHNLLLISLKKLTKKPS